MRAQRTYYTFKQQRFLLGATFVVINLFSAQIFANVPAPATPTFIQTNSSYLTTLWGEEMSETRVTLGMWSVHSTSKRRNGRNEMLGLTYRGLFAGTFVNSYYKRAIAIGFQRDWLHRPFTQNSDYEFGYRLGMVTGYKGHNMIGIKAVRNVPIIPFGQLVFSVNWRTIGWELSVPDPYVISASFFIRF